LARGDLAQFIIDQRHELIRRLGITPLHLLEDEREVAHVIQLSRIQKRIKPDFLREWMGDTPDLPAAKPA
jgi:hypothetical protein